VASNSTYVPLDGLAIEQIPSAGSCNVQTNGKIGSNKRPKDLLQALPDISIRFAVSEITANGSLGFGPVTTTAEGGKYRAILDYVNNDTVAASFYIRKIIGTTSGEDNKDISGVTEVRFSDTLGKNQKVLGYEAILYSMNNKPVKALQSEINARLGFTENPSQKDILAKKYQSITFPIYVGLGLRVTADVVSSKADLSISSIASVGTEGLSGGLTMQTIGVTGSQVSNILPIPSGIDKSTVQNTLLALGTSRALIYTNAQDKTKINLIPRVVGLYSPVGSNPALISAVYSEIAKHRIQWYSPCVDAS